MIKLGFYLIHNPELIIWIEILKLRLFFSIWLLLPSYGIAEGAFGIEFGSQLTDTTPIPDVAGLFEISPEIKERVQIHDQHHYNFHTNHCLSPEMIAHEDKSSSSSTTHNRFEILERRMPLLKSHKEFISLLKDHEGYPKSICSQSLFGMVIHQFQSKNSQNKLQ